ncbi:MAG: mannose-1-phosphate guanylyltransferase [Candidatus Neomarinimicrobiota bacterium]
MYCVILAGGKGTRFWPASRKLRPKQLLNIVGSEAMLQMTVNRLKKLNSVEDIYIVTGKDLAPAIRREIRGIDPENVLTEPSGKNTAPGIGLAALHIRKRKQDAIMGVFPSDHLIVGHKKFEKSISVAKHLANKNGSLITIGIQPTFPATGFGYIQFDPKSSEDHLNAFKVKTFAEKPHLKLATRFLESKDFLWNGGIFVWKVSSFFQELGQHMAELSEQLEKIDSLMERKKSIDSIWRQIIPESIDFGLMEKSNNIFVVQAEFSWNDLGSWDAVYEVSPKSKENNVVRGEGIVVDGKNNFIQSDKHFTAVLGIDDIVVINTKDATLVVPRDRVEEIKGLVNILEKQKRQDLL